MTKIKQTGTRRSGGVLRAGFIGSSFMLLFLWMSMAGAWAQPVDWTTDTDLVDGRDIPDARIMNSIYINVPPGGTATVRRLGAINSSCTLTKKGAGKLIILEGTYDGSTIVEAGTLQIGNGTAPTAFSTGGVTVNANATLRFEPSVRFLFDKVISGGGNVEHNGVGDEKTLHLAANNTYTGTTTIEAGSRLEIEGSNESSNIIINGNILVFQNGGRVVYNGVISGPGVLAKQNTGDLVLTGANTFTGACHFYGVIFLTPTGSIEKSGHVHLVNDAAVLNISEGNKKIRNLHGDDGSKVILGTRTLTIGTEGEEDGGGNFGGTITGDGGIKKTGSSELTIAHTDYTGGTNIESGRIHIIGNHASNIIVNGNSSVVFHSNEEEGTYSKVISGIGTAHKVGAAPLTFTGVHTYTGGTSVWNGPLVLSSSGSMETTVFLQLEDENAKLNISAGNKKIKDLRSKPNVSEVILGSRTLTVESGDYSGIISGAGGITKTGAENLTLSGANTASGALTLQQGKLTLANRWQGNFSKENNTELAIQGVVNIGGSTTLTGGNIYMDLNATPKSRMVIDGDMKPSGTNTLNIVCGNEDKLPLFQAKSGIEIDYFAVAPIVGILPTLSASANGAQLLLTTTKYETNTVVPVFVGLANSYTAGSAAVPLRVTGAGSDALKRFTVDGVTATSFNPEIARTYLIEASSLDGKLKIWKYVVVR